MTWPIQVTRTEWLAREQPGFDAPARVRRETLTSRLPDWAIALGLLAAVGASLGLALGVLLLVPVHDFFFSRNELAMRAREGLLAFMGAGVGLFVLPAGVYALFSRAPSVDGVVRTANVLSPLAITAFVPALFNVRAWSGRPLSYLALLAVTVVLTEFFVTRSLENVPGFVKRWISQPWLPARLARAVPLAIVVVAALGYAIYFSHYTLVNHRRFQTGAFDMGINVNWCYNALHGYPWRSTVLFGPEGGHFLANHAIYAMFIWLPLYALKPGAEVLLIYQATMCGLAAIPLYLFARKLIPHWGAVAVALAYLLYAPLHGANFYDYHELPVALPFHFLLYYCIVTERYRWVPLLVLILYAHREDLSLGLAVLGIFLLLTRLRPRLGATLTVVSVAVFILNRFVIMPYYGTWWFASMYKDLQPPGVGGFASVVQTILINPTYALGTLLTERKLIYALHLFAPIAFLPMRRFALLFLTIPGFFTTLLTTGYEPTISISFQYTTLWIPYLFAASVLALRLLREHVGAARQVGAICALAVGLLSHSHLFGAVFQHETFVGGFGHIIFEESDKERRQYEAFKKLVAKIPEHASVAATGNEVSHVGARLNVYMLNSHHASADYLLVRAGSAPTEILQDAFDKHRYALVGEAEKTFYLFKRDALTPANEADTSRAKRKLRIR